MPAQNQMLHAADWKYVETPGYRRRCEDKEISNWRVPLLEVFHVAGNLSCLMIPLGGPVHMCAMCCMVW